MGNSQKQRTVHLVALDTSESSDSTLDLSAGQTARQLSHLTGMVAGMPRGLS